MTPRFRTAIRPSQQKIAEFYRRSHILRLALFGSVLRDDFSPTSEVDVLVEFEPGHTPGYFGMSGLAQELSPFFGGRRIDLRTPAGLSRYFRHEVLAEAEIQYAACRRGLRPRPQGS